MPTTVTWSPADVLAAAAAWVWVPPDATEHETDEYRLTLYPDRALVHWSRTDRPVADLLGEVTGRVRSAGLGRLDWQVDDTTRPAGTEQELRARAFGDYETTDVYAWPLAGPSGPALPDLDLPPGVRVEPAVDETGVRLVGDLGATVFGWDPPSEAQVAGSVADLVPDPRTGVPRAVSYVAYAGGVPAGSAGVTFAGEAPRRVARLWSGCVLPAYRGRGLYRALLDARLRRAAADGATLALVKGRIETSGPTLSRAGFTAYGRLRTLRLALT